MTTFRTGFQGGSYDSEARAQSKSYQLGADNDPIAAALEAGLGDAQEKRTAPKGEYVPPWTVKRQVGPVIPHGWQEALYRSVKAWHSLIDDDALTAASDALLQATGKAEEAADAVRSLRSEQVAERDEAVRAAKAAAKAGEPIPEPKARDWEIEAEYREARWRELHKVAQRASAQYAATAKTIDPAQIIERAEQQTADKAKIKAHAEKVAAEVARAVQIDALLGEAGASLKLGPSWYRSDDDGPRDLPSKATSGADAAVRWLSSENHDVHAAFTDTSTVLPMATREWLAKQSENSWDFLARLEATEGYRHSNFTDSHSERYQGAVLYDEERAALAERRLP